LRPARCPEKQSYEEIAMSRAIVLLVLACWVVIVPASGQKFKEVKGTLAGVSAGRNEIFGFDSNANVWCYL
jgi:hypothetical protein